LRKMERAIRYIKRFPEFVRYFNTTEGLIRCRLIYDLFTLIFWFLYFYLKTKSIFAFTCSPLWKGSTCSDYVSSNTFWINFPFFAAIIVDVLVLYLLHKYTASKPNTIVWRVMWIHLFLVLVWIISAGATALWGLFPFLIIALVFDLYVLYKIPSGKGVRDRDGRISYVL